MDLKAWAKRLRAAADTIDALFHVAEDGKAARAILGSLDRQAKRIHWTLRPENAAKVRRMARRISKTRKARTVTHGE